MFVTIVAKNSALFDYFFGGRGEDFFIVHTKERIVIRGMQNFLFDRKGTAVFSFY